MVKNGQEGRKTPNPTTWEGENSEKGRIFIEGAPVGQPVKRPEGFWLGYAGARGAAGGLRSSTVHQSSQQTADSRLIIQARVVSA